MRTATRSQRPIRPTKEYHKSVIKPESHGKGGRPQIYDNVRFPHIAMTLCAEYGFTSEQLAKVFGVSLRTVNDWMTERPDFKKAVQAGKDLFDKVKVENALLKRALGYEFKEETKTRVWVNGKDVEGNNIKVPGIKTVTTIKELPPDVKACMFWLVNRDRERWKLESSVNANVKGTIEHKHSGTVVTAQLENLDDKQLLALRDMVAATQQNEPLLIGQDNPNDVIIDMDAIRAEAIRVQNEMYEDDGETVIE